jgi:iron complex outermembrane recepter protein
MNRVRVRGRRRRLWLSASAVAALWPIASPAVAQVDAAEVSFDIHAGPLDQALKVFARETHAQMLYDARLVAGRRVSAVKGRYTPRAALARLLAGTDLQADSPTANTIVLRPRPSSRPPEEPIRTGRSLGSPDASIPVDPSSGAAQGPAAPLAAPLATPVSAEGPSPASQASEVVVTGTHLRGVAETPSPVVVIGRSDIDQRGYATLSDALQALPQNFGGSANPQSLLAGMDASHTNTSLASGVNLRGLGSDATLVLVNGRRLAGTGALGDFADISTLPTAAIDRVEVLTDGASAIYGADAVGGVVNVIMRNDFDGAETRLRYGGTTTGPYTDTQLAQTFGKTWSGGNVLISYEYDLQTALPSDARPYAANADLVPFGGTDHRLFYSHPGNLLGFDPATDAYVPTYAIPKGQNGVGLTSADLIAGGENLQNQRADTEIVPRQERQSVYASFQQALGPQLTVSADLRYGRRRYDAEGGDQSTIFAVTPANPYFVGAPGGGATDIIGYDLGEDLGALRTVGLVQSVGASGGANLKLPGDWRLSGYGAYAAEFSSSRDENEINSSYLDEALGDVPDDPATAFSTARNGYFNPFGAGHDNSQAVDSFIASGFDTNRQASQIETAALQLDGSLFNLPGGPVKLAAGFQFRHESFSVNGLTFYSGDTPAPVAPIDVQRDVTAGYLELNVPLVGAENARTGVQKLTLSMAGRVEDYSDVGTTMNPKVGLIWGPLKDLSFHVSYGTSFRAPALAEVDAEPSYDPSLLPKGSSTVLSLILFGGNTALRPETADNWSAGATYVPRQLPALHLNATWFRTRFEDQIGQPANQNLLTVLSDPTLSTFVTYIDPTANAADLAKISALLSSPASHAMSLFPATAYGSIVDARYVNAAALTVSGIDVNASYVLRSGANRFDLDADGSYLLQYNRQLTPTSPTIELADTANYPLNFKGRLSGTWTRGVVSTTADVNYLNGEHDLTGATIGSWTTLDLQVALHSNAAAGPLRGVVLALNVANLLDTDPPFYNSPQGVGFDAANASALGRTLSLQLTKRW